MMENAKNTFYELELENGGTARLTLAYIYLLRLKNTHAATYKEYNRVITKGAQDELDNLTVLYTAYLCGLIADSGSTDGCMTYEEFLEVAPLDRQECARAIGMLLAPKKTMASAALS